MKIRGLKQTGVSSFMVLGTEVWHMACRLTIDMSRIVAILLFLLSLLLGSFQEGYAGEYAPSDEETALLELINQARTDPLTMAASLGLDRDAVLRDLPELSDMLTQGLSPLEFDQKLFEAALGHTEEMIAYGYYSHISLDGRTYADRIQETGYVAVGCGESLGMVGFQNLMTPTEAVRIIFESIFLAELDPDTTTPRNILNPERTQGGIAIGNGQFIKEGVTLNAYVATLDFGKPIADTETVERALFQMINEARSDPERALLHAGLDPARAEAAYAHLEWDWTDPLPPLAWNEDLYGTAAAHNRDMRDRQYFRTVTPDGVVPSDRIAGTGYDPVYVGESLGMLLVSADAGQGEAAIGVARRLFEQVLGSDVDPESDVERNLFNPFVTEMGIAVAAVPEGAGADPSISYLLVMDFAAPRSRRSFVVGTVYEDLNHNGRADEGEGIEDVKIIIKPGYSAIWEIVPETSGPMGGFQMGLSEFPLGLMDLYAEFDGEVSGPYSFWVETSGVNVLKNIPIAFKTGMGSTFSPQRNQKRLDRSMRICY